MEAFLKMLIPVAVGGLGIPLLVWCWQRFLPRPKTYMMAFKIGRAVTTWGDVKMGKVAFAKAENMAITTLYDICDGLRDGMRPEEKPEPTPPQATA